MRLFLIGFKGVGKSTIGSRLAATLNVPFFDTDRILEKMYGAPVRELFLREGSKRFGQWEEAALRQIPAGPAIVACGGRTPFREENLKLMEGTKVALKVDPKVLWERLSEDASPFLPSQKAFLRLYREREPLYQKIADLSVKWIV